MSTEMNDDIKRWTAKRKAALVMDIIQGKTTVSEASRTFDLSPSDIENWVDEAKRGMENALKAKPFEVKELYEKQIKDLQEAYGEAMLELRARKRACEFRRSQKSFSPDWSIAVFGVAKMVGQAWPWSSIATPENYWVGT